MRVSVLASIVMFLVGLGACGQAPAKTPVSIRFELIDNRVVVPMTINGKGPYRCILDTGAGAVISSRVAKEVGLKVTPTGQTTGVGGNAVESGTTRIDSVKIGGQQFRDEQFSIISFDDFPSVFGARPIDDIRGLRYSSASSSRRITSRTS